MWDAVRPKPLNPSGPAFSGFASRNALFRHVSSCGAVVATEEQGEHRAAAVGVCRVVS